MSLALGFSALSCQDDDDYSAATGVLVQGVSTGSSDVTATSATLNGTVKGLQSQSSSAYTVGFYYGSSENALTNSVTGSLDGETITADIDGLTMGDVIYYQAFVTLQKKLTYKGDVKSLTTTNAKITTADASNIDVNSVTIGGATTDAPATATAGVVIAASNDVEAVRAGLKVQASDIASISVDKAGLLPGATYYYAAYLDLGTGEIFGDVKEFTTKTVEVNVDDIFVDLGLSTKWAKYNVGAQQPEELGGLFSFGDLYGVTNSKVISDYTIASDIYKTANDVAFKAFDGKATMPSADEFEELFQNCEVEWTEVNGVKGCQFTGPNGNSIFLPAAGSRTGNTVTEEGVKGLYLTGSVNPSKSEFAISYEFANGANDKTTTPRFQALSVRAVTVAKNIAIDKALLATTWVLDITESGESYVWDGPLGFYGTDDCWANITNNEPYVSGDHWNWTPKYSENTWLGDAADYGTMTFNEDGTVNIHRRVKTTAEDGTETVSYVDETGNYTIDNVNKTISLDIDILGFGNFNNLTLSAKTNLKIFSLTETSMQIAILRDPDLSGEGACSLAYQYITKKVLDDHQAINVSMMTVGGDWGGSWGDVVGSYSPSEIESAANGIFTATAKWEGAMNGAKVFLLDFVGLVKRFPGCAVVINSMKADGKDVTYDAAKFHYGAIDNADNYRVEFFNVWGSGTHKVGCSPFSNNTEQLDDSEPAVSCSESIEVNYSIILNPAISESSVEIPISFITCNSSWGCDWSWTDGQTLKIGFDSDAHTYTFEPQTFKITFTSDIDYTGGTIMSFFQVNNVYAQFPALHATLDALSIDGKEVTFDSSKVIDSNESPNYRLELWNCYGATKTAGCAFGTPDGDVIKELGFTDKMEMTVTFHSIF